MFFRNYSTYVGEPARIYRSPERIREDIFDIKTKIESVDSMLNVRSVLTDMMDRLADGDTSDWIAALSELVAEAESTLALLKGLNESLDILTEELEDTKWALGI